jgi:transposase InsO family protein
MVHLDSLVSVCRGREPNTNHLVATVFSSLRWWTSLPARSVSSSRALEMAIRRRCPETGLLHHSDQGSTYASEDYQDLLAEHGIACSMSRRGNCLDNAAMESWFSTLKFELGEDFESIHLAKEQLFDYIEVFYNQQRRHSSIDYVSPARHERERRAAVQLAA